MKSIFKYIAMACLFPLSFLSCEDMNSLHQQYIDRGEIIYLGGLNSVAAYPGYNKVKLDWIAGTDTRVTKTVFYWNLGNDSIAMPVNISNTGIQTMTRELPQGVYAFEVFNEDNVGNKSLPQAVTIEVYGDNYKESLRNVNVLSIVVPESKDSVTINWAGIESGTTQYTTVQYLSKTTPNPIPNSIRVENNTAETLILFPSGKQVQPTDSISVVTTYLPIGGIDIVDAYPKKYPVLSE
jgi:hypothetical protein